MLNSFISKPVLVMFAVVVAISGCSSKPKSVLSGVDEVQASIVPGSMADFRQNASSVVLFPINQSSLTVGAREILSKQANWIRQYPGVRMKIAGHADERGTREYNIALSARRAAETKAFLISQGVKANQLSTVAYGKERPASVCDNESCWSQNRRSETHLVGGAVQG